MQEESEKVDMSPETRLNKKPVRKEKVPKRDRCFGTLF